MASIPALFLESRGGYGSCSRRAENPSEFLHHRSDGRRRAAVAHILLRNEKTISTPEPRVMSNNHDLEKALRLGHSRLLLPSSPVKRKGSSRILAAVVSSDSKSQQEKEMEIVKLPVSVDYISSPSNAYIKHLVRLRQNPKARNATASVLVVGTIPLREICESVEKVGQQWRKIGENRDFVIDVLLVREDAANAVSSEELAMVSRRVVRVSSDAMSKLSGMDSPPELAGVLGFPSTFTAFKPNSSFHEGRNWCCNPKPRRILVLDSIQDPGNMGTLLRTAAAFAWDGVFLLQGCCDPFNDKALRASRGAGFRVPIGVGEWGHVRDFAIANELKLYAGDPQPEMSSRDGFSPITQHDVDGELRFPTMDDGQGLCLVLGSEGQGLSHHVLKDCVPIGIPMPGDFESLNVAVAGGILMFLLR